MENKPVSQSKPITPKQKQELRRIFDNLFYFDQEIYKRFVSGIYHLSEKEAEKMIERYKNERVL
ncbi:MAG: hypothetical protein ABEJ24_03910 [Candidatus Magasanikbacteria bacterium]